MILGLLFILGELVAGIQTGFDLVLLGSILIIGGFGGIVFGDITIAYAICVGLSFVYIMFGRTVIKKQLFILTKSTNIDKLIGKTGTVVRSVTPDTAGMIRVDDEDWRASADEVVYEKEKVKVVAVEGVTLVVKKIKS